MKSFRWPALLLAGVAASCFLFPAVRAADDKKDDKKIDPFDQSGVPLEVEPTDAKAIKVVLVAGRASHSAGDHEFFAGTAIIANLLKQTEGVYPVMARDGWPKNPKIFEGAKAVVFYMDGGGGHPILQKDHREVVQKLVDQGVGFVNIHYAVEYPKKDSEPVLNWLGGYYETGFSTNPHWVADFKTLADHPIARGVKPFNIKDEWYFNIRFTPEMKGVTPILKATPPDNVRNTAAAKEFKGREEIVAWAYQREKNDGRSFGFTGGHTHKNWGDENFRRLVTNAILWSAHVEVPKDGAKVALDPEELQKNLDRKGK
ncbi:MAG: ThuA domain-containing protein [Gemmataceae bacterium]|nr:ThuA domain-containing protein [Gemmataceae bacterium]